MTEQITPLQAMLNKTGKYEGWTNKPTWCVNLWLSNDEKFYRDICDIVAFNRVQYKGDAYLSQRIGDAIHEYTEEHCILHQDDGTLEADLITWALAYVNWEEIAEAWLEE